MPNTVRQDTNQACYMTLLAVVHCSAPSRVSLDTDQGCNMAPSCLNCHLPKCKEDMTRAEFTDWKRHQKTNHISTIYKTLKDNHPDYRQNMLASLTAKTAQVSIRTVWRYLAAARTT